MSGCVMTQPQAVMIVGHAPGFGLACTVPVATERIARLPAATSRSRATRNIFMGTPLPGPANSFIRYRARQSGQASPHPRRRGDPLAGRRAAAVVLIWIFWLIGVVSLQAPAR